MRFKKNLLAIMNEHPSGVVQNTLRKSSIVASPRLRPPSSCTISSLQSPVFHLPSSSSPQHRSHGIWTLSFNPQNTQNITFLVAYFLVHAMNSSRTCLHSTLSLSPLTRARRGRSSTNDFISGNVMSEEWCFHCFLWGVRLRVRRAYIWQNIKW